MEDKSIFEEQREHFQMVRDIDLAHKGDTEAFERLLNNVPQPRQDQIRTRMALLEEMDLAKEAVI